MRLRRSTSCQINCDYLCIKSNSVLALPSVFPCSQSLYKNWVSYRTNHKYLFQPTTTMRSWCYYLSLDVVVDFVLYGGGSPVHLNAARKLVSCQSRIKKIMQKNAEIGRIAMAVPVIICILHTSLTSREKHLLLNATDDAWRVNYLTWLTEICPWRRW